MNTLAVQCVLFNIIVHCGSVKIKAIFCRNMRSRPPPPPILWPHPCLCAPLCIYSYLYLGKKRIEGTWSTMNSQGRSLRATFTLCKGKTKLWSLLFSSKMRVTLLIFSSMLYTLNKINIWETVFTSSSFQNVFKICFLLHFKTQTPQSHSIH